ncbi:hypothetical protein QL093DRAFT_2641483 [Fusarium oxysporum]|nr:hypothetical protein QL093DRAFT_2641483 [Fusarium oxysporum]
MSDEAALFGSAQIITPKYFRMITRSISSLPDEKIPTMKRTTSPNDESNTVSRLTILPDILMRVTLAAVQGEAHFVVQVASNPYHRGQSVRRTTFIITHNGAAGWPALAQRSTKVNHSAKRLLRHTTDVPRPVSVIKICARPRSPSPSSPASPASEGPGPVPRFRAQGPARPAATAEPHLGPPCPQPTYHMLQITKGRIFTTFYPIPHLPHAIASAMLLPALEFEPF